MLTLVMCWHLKAIIFELSKEKGWHPNGTALNNHHRPSLLTRQDYAPRSVWYHWLCLQIKYKSSASYWYTIVLLPQCHYWKAEIKIKCVSPWSYTSDWQEACLKETPWKTQSCAKIIKFFTIALISKEILSKGIAVFNNNRK